MSELREHFESAKREYESARYPGDLARDAMRIHRASRRMRIIVRSALTVAAMIAVIVIARIALRDSESQPTEQTQSIAKVENTKVDDASDAISMTTVSAPSWADVFSVEKSDSSAVADNPTWPSMPSFPTMDQIDESSVGQTLDNQENE